MSRDTDGIDHDPDQTPRRRGAQRPRKRRPSGRWADPTTPLQAARFERRQTGQEVVDAIRNLCPGHGSQPCRLDVAKLSDHERGARRPGLTHIEAFARYYNKSPEALGLITWRGQSNLGDHSEDPDTARDVLLGLLTIALQPAPIDPDPDAFRSSAQASSGAGADPLVSLAWRDQQRLATTKLSADQLTRLQQDADQHACDYYQLTTLTRLHTLTTDWTTARSLLDLPQTPSQRLLLTRTYAQLTAILATLAFDHDRPERASALLETAQDAAREAGDTDLTGWILEQRGMIADWRHNPKQVIALTEYGLDAAVKTGTPTVARLHARAAAAHATLGDPRAVTTHLEAAERILNRDPTAGCWPTEPAMPRAFSFSPDALLSASAKCHLRLGNHLTVVTQCQEATVLQHRHGLSARTALAVQLNHLHLATALARTDELDQAQHVALTSIQDYQGVAVPLLLRRAHELNQELAAADPGSPRGQAFAEFLHDHATRARRHP